MVIERAVHTTGSARTPLPEVPPMRIGAVPQRIVPKLQTALEKANSNAAKVVSMKSQT